MAYAAVISLKHTIQRLQNSSQIPIVSSNREIIGFAYEEVKSLQHVLERLASSSSKRLNALDGQIRETVHKLEDLLESHESNHFLSQFESHGDEGFSHILSVDLEEEINSFGESVTKMKEEYIKELSNPLPEEDHVDAVSSRIDFGGKMVGFSDELTKIKNQLLARTRPNDFGVFSFVGMAGTCRSVVAKTIFDDLYIGKEESFDCGAWLTIGGPKYEFKEILLRILAQIDPAGIDKLLSEEVEKLSEYLYTSLKGRRYIILLDDIWDTQVWSYLKKSFPEQNNRSLVLLTTRLKEVAQFADSFLIYELASMDVDEDHKWNIIREVMFGEESCPLELEEAGKKIAKNCPGLRLPFAKVLLYLSKVEKTPQYWNKLAAEKENSIFVVADEISEICKIKEDLQWCNSYPVDATRTIEYVSAILELSDLIITIKSQMFPKRLLPEIKIISVFGMAGIGKTTLVKEIFEDPSILYHFDHRAWVTLGPKYQPKEILEDILSQIYPDIDKIRLKRDEKFAKDLCTQLCCKRCLIVLDDVWNQKVFGYWNKLLPEIKGKVLLTTRIAKVTHLGEFDTLHELSLLNKEESWCLLHQKVFGDELCPPKLEKAGKKIAENCEGLPLTIVTVADLLSKAEKTPEYWNKVAEKENSVFMDAHNEISKALLPSYNFLPPHLKVCFLYMGIFPQKHDVPCFKIIKLWIAEGFLEPNPSQTVEDFAVECLLELVNRTLVMVRQESTKLEVKTCGLHSVFWHLSNNEAGKNKFFHVLNSLADGLAEGIKSQRRLCFNNSILFGIKDVHNSVASISTVRSLLCTGPPHKYPVPICFGLRLLRVLDALTIRFYEFPIEVLKLVQLRYLAVTCNGNLPPSISKLRNLHFLIVLRHLSIKFSGAQSYLPMEIWDMQELKHLQIMGSNLPNPTGGALLPNILALLDVSAHCFTKGVLKRIRNLKRLGIRIELAPDNDGKPFRCLNRICRLRKLESLKCVIVNPEHMHGVVAPPLPLSIVSSSLKKLTLSGFGYPWEDMCVIGSLSNLEVLKLRCYAFRGPKWETNYKDLYLFQKLKFLLIEDTDLVHWKVKTPSFPNLDILVIKDCYKLEEIPWIFITTLRMIRLVDCNSSAVACAKRMEENDLNDPFNFGHPLKVYVDSSWNDGKLK